MNMTILTRHDAISSLDAHLESVHLYGLRKKFLFSIFVYFIKWSFKVFYRYSYVGEACIRSASVYFCEALLFKTRWQNAHHGCFLCSIKAKICIDIVSAHNKVDPLHLI